MTVLLENYFDSATSGTLIFRGLATLLFGRLCFTEGAPGRGPADSMTCSWWWMVTPGRAGTLKLSVVTLTLCSLLLCLSQYTGCGTELELRAGLWGPPPTSFDVTWHQSPPFWTNMQRRTIKICHYFPARQLLYPWASAPPPPYFSAIIAKA